jgi:hypothetical protein
LLFIGSVKLLGTLFRKSVFRQLSYSGIELGFPLRQRWTAQAGAVLSELFHFSNGSRQAVAELAHWIASVHTPGLRTCRPPLGILTAVVWNNGIIVSMGRLRQTTGLQHH